jgi:hypothetical protein
MQGTTIQRNQVRPVIGNDLLFHAGIYETLSFSVELARNTDISRPPPYDPLLRACNLGRMDESGQFTYYPIPDCSGGSVTLVFQSGSTLHRLVGCRGNCSVSVTVEQIPKIEFTFQGFVMDRQNEYSLSGYTLTEPNGYAVPRPVSNENSGPLQVLFASMSNSAAICAQGITVDLRNDVAHKHLILCRSMDVVDARPTGQITIEEPDLNDRNFYGAIRANETGLVKFEHDGISIGGYQAQLIEPGLIDLNGKTGLNLNVRFTAR